jgi:AcrR family transcriptional regulator
VQSAPDFDTLRVMARWEPNARGRLQQAAMELFRERGYAQTTVQDIAAHAGLTERTFFRYFADKREVLFSGGAELQAVIVDALAAAPRGTTPLDAALAGLAAAAEFMQPFHERARARHALIMAHPDLQERELHKLTALATAIGDALVARGVADPTARLAAEASLAVFKVGFHGWVEGGAARATAQPFAHHLRAALDDLKAVVAGATAVPSAPHAARPRAPRTRRSA